MSVIDKSGDMYSALFPSFHSHLPPVAVDNCCKGMLSDYVNGTPLCWSSCRWH